MKMSKKKYVAVVGFTKDGKTKFLKDILTWTTSLNDAFKWDSLAIAKSDIKSIKSVRKMEITLVPCETED